MTDRRDFYHQFWSSDARAVSNSIGPALPFSLVRDLDAAKTLALGEKLKKKQPRVFRGDGLGTSLRQRFSSLDDQVLVSFKSIL